MDHPWLNAEGPWLASAQSQPPDFTSEGLYNNADSCTHASSLSPHGQMQQLHERLHLWPHHEEITPALGPHDVAPTPERGSGQTIDHPGPDYRIAMTLDTTLASHALPDAPPIHGSNTFGANGTSALKAWQSDSFDDCATQATGFTPMDTAQDSGTRFLDTHDCFSAGTRPVAQEFFADSSSPDDVQAPSHPFAYTNAVASRHSHASMPPDGPGSSARGSSQQAMLRGIEGVIGGPRFVEEDPLTEVMDLRDEHSKHTMWFNMMPNLGSMPPAGTVEESRARRMRANVLEPAPGRGALMHQNSAQQRGGSDEEAPRRFKRSYYSQDRVRKPRKRRTKGLELETRQEAAQTRKNGACLLIKYLRKSARVTGDRHRPA